MPEKTICLPQVVVFACRAGGLHCAVPPAVLADHDAVGIGVNLDWTSDRAGGYRVLFVVEAHEAGLGDRCLHRVEAIEPARIRAAAIPVIGLLTAFAPGDSPHLIAAFRQGLKDTGFVEGQNVAIEYRFAGNQNDRLPALAADLVHMTRSLP
jgi:hypothetical protein